MSNFKREIDTIHELVSDLHNAPKITIKCIENILGATDCRAACAN